jgi:hypothetical protein
MVALFALGAMSLAWMTLISAPIAIERLLPWRALATGAVASLLAALVIPGSPTAVRDGDVIDPSHEDTEPGADGIPHGLDVTLGASIRSRGQRFSYQLPVSPPEQSVLTAGLAH